MTRPASLWKQIRAALPRKGQGWPLAGYAAALALGAIVLSWLDLQRLTRTLPGDAYVALMAAAFLGLGVWLGWRLFAGAAQKPLSPGNPDAADALGLTEREREVLALLAAGLSNKEIAQRLSVSPNTIKTHLARLFEKLGAKRRTEAVARARELNLLA